MELLYDAECRIPAVDYDYYNQSAKQWDYAGKTKYRQPKQIATVMFENGWHIDVFFVIPEIDSGERPFFVGFLRTKQGESWMAYTKEQLDDFNEQVFIVKRKRWKYVRNFMVKFIREETKNEPRFNE